MRPGDRHDGSKAVGAAPECWLIFKRLGQTSTCAELRQFQKVRFSLFVVFSLNHAELPPRSVPGTENAQTVSLYSCLYKRSISSSVSSLVAVHSNCSGQKHDKQRELSFWKTHHKSIKAHLPVAATASTGHHASLCVDLVPVEPPLRPRQG
jgi:hypothetical protein